MHALVAKIYLHIFKGEKWITSQIHGYKSKI